MKFEGKIELPIHGIIVEFNEQDCATIQSDLLETCPYCTDPRCDGFCKEWDEAMKNSTGNKIIDLAAEDERKSFISYRHAIHGVESLILALAVQGFDIKSAPFLSAIETAIDSISNNI